MKLNQENNLLESDVTQWWCTADPFQNILLRLHHNYNHGLNILRTLVALPNFLLTSSERKHDY